MPKRPRQSEHDIKADITNLCNGWGVKLWNNAVGGFKNGAGHFFRFGLGKGTGDKIGYKTVIITPDMVGKRFAIFVSCETKTEVGKLSPEQREHLREVIAGGGIAFVARDAETAVGILHGDGWRKWFRLE